MEFKIYNTMSREKEVFTPIKGNEVGLYTCGPTVYNYAHIGNLRTYIFEDILVKSLKYYNYNVKHVMNITDVGHLESDSDTGEDKMLLGAQRENKSVWEVARHYEEAFFADCEKLNIERPTVACRATEHVEDMINLVKKLEEKGYTYISNGNVYYEIDKFKDYFKLANLSMDELEAGIRIEIDEGKKNPLDFVLWFTNSKFKNQIMQWESPWGKGFPGWHLECSAMAIKYLGEKIDIHCGGIDHKTVHHTNEIAQSEGVLGHKWVNYWMHGEFLIVDSGKMSKSSGDFLTLSRLFDEGIKPVEYRFFCLQSRYRKQLLFSYDNLKDASNSYKSLKKRISSIINSIEGEKISNIELMNEYKNAFAEQLGDDLNTPNAITVLYDVIKEEQLNNAEKQHLIEDFDKVLCLDLRLADDGGNIEKDSNIDIEKIEILINERNLERSNKNWENADIIRQKLLELNIEILDTKEGTTWKIKG